jgi:hypothetical protein
VAISAGSRRGSGISDRDESTRGGNDELPVVGEVERRVDLRARRSLRLRLRRRRSTRRAVVAPAAGREERGSSSWKRRACRGGKVLAGAAQQGSLSVLCAIARKQWIGWRRAVLKCISGLY